MGVISKSSHDVWLLQTSDLNTLDEPRCSRAMDALRERLSNKDKDEGDKGQPCLIDLEIGKLSPLQLLMMILDESPIVTATKTLRNDGGKPMTKNNPLIKAQFTMSKALQKSIWRNIARMFASLMWWSTSLHIMIEWWIEGPGIKAV